MTETGIARPLVKICGLREESTVLDMTGLPVDYIGFMFAPSKRQVTAERAAKLLETARRTSMGSGRPPLAVGVFVNPSMEELTGILERVPLDVVQLHGQETPAFCREVGARFGVEVWRALAADGESGPEALAEFAGAISTVLLDTAGGGTGRTFRWEVIPSYQAETDRLGLRLFVAGGLTADNVAELLSGYSPDGVDTSSGVETDGIKDSKKIAAFAERVNRT